jgi:hypothetical protein
MARVAFTIDQTEEVWTPPAMPERDALAFGAAPETPLAPIDPSAPAFDDPSPFADTPVAEAPVAPAPITETAQPQAQATPPMPSDPEPAAAAPAHLSHAETPASDALAKLLGVAPSNFDAPPAAPVSTPSTPSDPATNFFARQSPPPSPAEPETPWEAPVFNTEPPSKLAEAIPTGESFESGMESLLTPDTGRTAAGLVKRDRTKNHAPESEGRRVASSVRSPDEIRSMLSRYRSGLKGKPLEDMATPPMPDAPAPGTTTNTFDSNGDF